MEHDTPWTRQFPVVQQPNEHLGTMLQTISQDQHQDRKPITRGRPARLSDGLMVHAIVWCLLHGWKSQWDLWRRVSTFGVWGQQAVAVCDQAVYKWLANKGEAVLQRWCGLVSQWLFEHSAPFEDRRLAPFASEVLAIDESTLDARPRWLAELRGVPKGSTALLAGRLSCVFDVRRQLWRRIDWLKEAGVSCQRHVQELVASLPTGSVLLFDLGYSCFEWFDQLTERGFWWVSRVRSRDTWTLEHVLVQRDGYLDALIFLGAYRADRTAHLMRLVQLRYRGQWYRYITNVLDPLQLPGADVVRLYGRRWDSELGFRLLKDHAQLNWLWSAKDAVLAVQLWATVLLAQLLHRLQVEVAQEQGVELFDVSLDLLLRYLPHLAQLAQQQQSSLNEVIAQAGARLGLIRPHTRLRPQVPIITWADISWPPPDLCSIREPRYAHKSRGSHGDRKKSQKRTGCI